MKKLVLLVTFLILAGCVQPSMLSDDESSGIHNMGSIANVLGCMFAPQDPSCTKKQPSESEKEADEKEWNEVK